VRACARAQTAKATRLLPLRRAAPDSRARAPRRSLVIANAGVSESTMKLEREIEAATRALFATNVDGVFNTILPLLGAMKERRAGQIVLMSSLAATGPLPGSVAYSATKAAVRVYGEALRASVYRDGVRVNVVCPGYVESDMTAANKSAMPGLMTMKAAMRVMTRGIARDVPVIQFPTSLHTAFWAISRVLPPGLMHVLARRRWLPGFLAYLRPRRDSSRK
jgi:NAD(P)-dependent dehydrogenase (short-subunit alcohol dehydrogenase family)